jgi:hypothetical protein
MSLAEFFDAWGALLRGDASPDETEARLGPSPSGTDAVAFCQRLYHHHRETTLRQLFPMVAALLGAEAFARLTVAYAAAHPAQGAEIRAWGEAFPAFVAAWGGAPPSERAGAADLALLAQARRRVRYAVDDAPGVLVVVGHDALATERALRAGELAVIRPGPRALLVFRPTGRASARDLVLDGPRLAAWLTATGQPVPAALAAVDASVGRAALVRAGAIAARGREL